MKFIYFTVILLLTSITTIAQSDRYQFNRQDVDRVFEQGDLDSIEFFIDRYNIDVNKNYPDENILPFLFYACSSGNIEIVKLMFEKGAQANVISRYGTPADWAMEKGQIHIINELLNHGFDPKIMEMAYWVTKYKEGYKDIPDWLVEKIQYVLDNNIDYSSYPYYQFIDPAGLLLLSASIYYDTTCSLDLTRRLLDKNVNIHLVDKNGLNALNYCILALNPNAVQLLIEHNANVNWPVYNLNYSKNPALMNNNLTPLHFIAYYIDEKPEILESNYDEIIRIVEILVDAGADLNAKTKTENFSVIENFKRFDDKGLVNALK